MSGLALNNLEEADGSIQDYFELLKPKVMRLVIFTATVGLIAAPSPIHPFIAFASLLCVAVGAGSAGALNMWWDADVDSIMKRTRSRPIPSGRITKDQALALGMVLSVLSVMMLGLFSNYFSAALLAFTIFFYIFIYSMWLKRLTPQNIVIGGAAGAFPPMIGWSIATGGVNLESFFMFLLIFIWTPPHFWTLAMFMKEDYTEAKIPMLTVVKGMSSTRKNIFIYTILLSMISFIIAFTEIGGVAYFCVALALNSWFLIGSIRILLRQEKTAEADLYYVEKRLFVFSIFYLFAHFTAIALEVFLRAMNLNLVKWPLLF